jgi:hypothetical protein
MRRCENPYKYRVIELKFSSQDEEHADPLAILEFDLPSSLEAIGSVKGQEVARKVAIQFLRSGHRRRPPRQHPKPTEPPRHCRTPLPPSAD